MSTTSDTQTQTADQCPDSSCNPDACSKEECNIKCSTIEQPTDQPTDQPPVPQQNGAPPGQINLIHVDIDSTNTALNVMVGFLGLAQKRGAFAINESAKIFECIEKFT